MSNSDSDDDDDYHPFLSFTWAPSDAEPIPLVVALFFFILLSIPPLLLWGVVKLIEIFSR